MTIPLEVEIEIRRLHYGEKWPVGTIASQLGLHEEVVRRVLGLLNRPKPKAPRKLLVDPYKEFISETLSRYPKLRSTRLFDMISARGYPGTPRTLRNYVAQVRPRPEGEVFLRLEPLIGEQAQIDWMHVAKMKVSGGERSLWAFVMVLSYSRAMWGELVFDTTVHSLTRSLVRACNYFGGTSRQWLFDNAKTIVLERCRGAVRFHPLLLELSGHYRAQLRLCAVGKANQKGRVERTNRFLRDRFFAGRTVSDIEHVNRELLAFIEEVAHPRPHPTQPGLSVAQCFLSEKQRLLPLPSTPFPIEHVAPLNVDKTACFRFDTNSYSVPPTYARKTLTLAADDQWVRALDGAVEVAKHRRRWGKRERVELLEHREELLRRKRAARESKGLERLRAVSKSMDALIERWVNCGRNIGSMVSKTLRLLDLYGDELLRQAIEQVLSRGMHDPGALAILCEQRRKAQFLPVPVDIEFGKHVPDCDVIPHGLEQYDAKR